MKRYLKKLTKWCHKKLKTKTRHQFVICQTKPRLFLQLISSMSSLDVLEKVKREINSAACLKFIYPTHLSLKIYRKIPRQDKFMPHLKELMLTNFQHRIKYCNKCFLTQTTCQIHLLKRLNLFPTKSFFAKPEV